MFQRSFKRVTTSLAHDIKPKTSVQETVNTENTAKEIGKKAMMVVGYGAFWSGICLAYDRFQMKPNPEEKQKQVGQGQHYMPHRK